MVRLTRSSIAAIAFLALFALIAGLSGATAMATSGPWYDATVSLEVYVTSLVVATTLVLVLVFNAVARLGLLETSRALVDVDLASLEAAGTVRSGRRLANPVAASFEAFERSAVLEGLAIAGVPSSGSPEKDGHDALVPATGIDHPVPRVRGADGFRLLVQERIAITEARRRLWPTVAGPLLASIIFLTIAAPMLPGAGGFAAAHFQLNTALILFLSYGLGPLVLWALVSLATAGTRTSGSPE